MNHTLESDVAAFLDTLHTPNTRSTYAQALRRFTTFAERGGIADHLMPQTSEIAGYLESLHTEGLAPASRCLRITAVKMFYRWLVRQGRLTPSAGRPVDALALPVLPERLPRVLTVEQMRLLVEAPRPKSRMYLRDKALLEFLYASGCRASEGIDLRMDDLDLDAATARVRGKGGKERIVLLGEPAAQALHAYILLLRPDLARRQPQPLPRVFLARTGKRMTREYVWNLVNGYAVQAGLPAWVGAHSLRHAAATHLLQGGADVRFAQEILGHASAETTTIYLHIDVSHLRRAHSRLDACRRPSEAAPAPAVESLPLCHVRPRKRRREWSEEDCQALRTLSAKEAAEKLGITPAYAKWMRRVLRVAKHPRWTPCEDQLLRQMPSIKEAARQTGRTIQAVKERCRRLRRIEREKGH